MSGAGQGRAAGGSDPAPRPGGAESDASAPSAGAPPRSQDRPESGANPWRDAPISSGGLVFLGCGFATGLHAKLLARRHPAVPRFFASRDGARADLFSREMGGAGAFASYEAALADPRPAAAVVATPPGSHLRWTLAALEAGKDVVVEKPAFLSSADAAAVARAAAAAGRRVFVAENYHYKPVLRRLREIVAAGELGRILFVHVNALKRQRVEGWRGDAAVAGGGALFEGGIHWVAFMAGLGLGVRRVRGFRPGGGGGAAPGPRSAAPVGPRAAHRRHADEADAGAGDSGAAERSMLLVLEYEGGGVGTLSYSWEVPSPLKGVRLSRIFGSAGSVAFESNGLALLQLGARRRLAFPDVRDLGGYRGMWDDFLGALRTGREPAYTLASAARDLALVEEAYRTAEAEE